MFHFATKTETSTRTTSTNCSAGEPQPWLEAGVYLRHRYYQPITGRFNRLDPFAGNMDDPQSLHKYLYANADPVNRWDPTGTTSLTQKLTVVGLASLTVGIGMVPVYMGSRNPSYVAYPYGTKIPVTFSRLEVHYHSVRIENATRSADAIFSRMQQFTQLDLGPVQAFDDAGDIGTVIRWDMKNLFVDDFGQGDFEVEVVKFDPNNRFFAVRTRSGHPLAGWRAWRIQEFADGDILIETFSVEHPVTWMDSAKLHAGGLEKMHGTWTSMLSDLVVYSGGSVVVGGDSVWEGERRHEVQQYLDHVYP